MSEESNLESASIDRTWIDKILEILLLNTSVEEHSATKKRFFEIAFQMFHEGSFYSDNDTSCRINLGNFITEDGHFDFTYFESVIKMAVRFIDNEHLRSKRKNRESTVTINLHDFESVFDAENTITDESKNKTVHNIIFFTARTAIQASMSLVDERGSMGHWKDYVTQITSKFMLDVKPYRNSIVVQTVSEPNINIGKYDLT